jgi:hypothetical protein
MPWTFFNSNGEALTSFGPVALTDLDIDGGTAIGEAVVGADLFIMDNGAGGTNVKVTATEVATFIGVPAQANQAALEAETNQDTYAPPDLIKHSPGVAKVWASFEQIGAHGLNQSYNVSSVSDGGGAGDSDFVWDIDFANATYAAIGGAGTSQNIGSATPAAGTLRVLVKAVADGANEDTSEGFIMGLGTQV